MTVTASRTFFFALLALAAGCSSSSSDNGGGAPQSDAGTTPDTGTKKDGGGGVVDISGSLDISVTVQEGASGVANKPLAAAKVRVEAVSDGAHAYFEGATDEMGVAHIKVDPAKGPFDVTVAQAGYNAISVLNVTGPVPGNIVLYQIGAAASSKEHMATGAIKGIGAGHTVQLDAWDWQTVVTDKDPTTFSTKFSESPSIKVPLPVAAIEYDPTTSKAIKGYLTPTIDRPTADTTINIDFATGAAPTTSTVSIQWPADGMFTAASVKTIGSPVNDKHLGNAIVEQLTTAELGAAMFCGVADLGAPANGASPLALQIFGGNLKPDVAGALVYTIAQGQKQLNPTDFGVLVQPHNLADGSKLAVGKIGAMTITCGASDNLDKATIAVDTTGYDAAFFTISTGGQNSTTVWTMWAPGGQIASRKLPHLPNGIKLADLGGDIQSADLNLLADKFAAGAPAPWEAILNQLEVQAFTGPTSCDPTGR